MPKIKSDANDLAVIERYDQVVNYLYPIIQHAKSSWQIRGSTA